MATGWQREFASQARHDHWNEKCLREDIAEGKLEGKTPLELAAQYDLSEHKVKKILEAKNKSVSPQAK